MVPFSIIKVRPSGSLLVYQKQADEELLCSWLQDNPIDTATVGWLAAQGLAPYAFYQLRSAGVLPALPAAIHATLRSAYVVAAANQILLSTELAAVLEALRPLGVEPIVLKGMALGVTLYPDPATRPTSDLDLLIEKSQIGAVRQALQDRGYRDAGLNQEQHQAFTHHLHMWREPAGGSHIAVEAHWHLVHEPGYARYLSLDGMRARAGRVDLGGYSARALSSTDALIHACAHLLLHHSQDWRLLWLLDLRLLVERYGTTWEWPALVEQAREAHLAAALRYWLDLTEAWFGPFLPGSAWAALMDVSATQEEDRHIRIAHTGHQRIWQRAWNWAQSTGNWRSALAYVREIFIPPWAYMQYRYGARTRWLAPLYYGWRFARAGLVAFKRVGRGRP